MINQQQQQQHQQTDSVPLLIGRCLALPTLIAMLGVSPSAVANSEALSIDINAYAHSFNITNIAPIKSIIDDNWHSDVENDGDFGVSQTRVGLSMNIESLLVGIETRSDHYLAATPRSTQLYKYIKTAFPVDTDNDLSQSYELDMQYQTVRAKSFWIGHQWQLTDSIEITNKVHFWTPQTYRSSYLTGQINHTANQMGEESGHVSGQANMEEWYTHKNLLKRPEQSTWNDSTGQSWDLAVKWHISNSVSLNVDIKDLYNAFSFDHIGYSKGTLNSDTTSRDSSGVLRFNPAYRGVESKRRLNVSLPSTTNITLDYQLDSGSLFLNHQRIEDITRSNVVGYQHNTNNDSAILLGFDVDYHAIQLGYRSGQFVFTLVTDEWQLHRAKNLSLRTSYTTTF